MNWYKISQLSTTEDLISQDFMPQETIQKKIKPESKRDIRGKFAPKDYLHPQLTPSVDQQQASLQDLPVQQEDFVPENIQWEDAETGQPIQENKIKLPIIKNNQIPLADQDQQIQNAQPEQIRKDTIKVYPQRKNTPIMLALQFANKPQNTPGFSKSSGQVIWIDYVCKSGKRIQRNVCPHGIFTAKTGNTICVTFDQTANGIRGFIVNNIKDYRFTGRQFNRKFIFRP